jgi:hypothetical protein
VSVLDLWNMVKLKTYKYGAVLTAALHNCCESLQRSSLSVVFEIVLC